MGMCETLVKRERCTSPSRWHQERGNDRAITRFESLDGLADLQLDVQNYGRLSHSGRSREYPNSREIAEARAFPGTDGISVPGAHAPGSKDPVIFRERDTLIEKDIARRHRRSVPGFSALQCSASLQSLVGAILAGKAAHARVRAAPAVQPDARLKYNRLTAGRQTRHPAVCYGRLSYAVARGKRPGCVDATRANA